ncbi:hypothetical protein [Neisseria animalis]|uniref:Uncharacterized protein n=1 Tax=Neisseria animalis TaxID=492 RepID=A0A5P3MQX1_NEIAN|nr:hypothetical protein [Neisseria animalis]QEY23455.1 hypothetical protein D0T90_02200 [Neisseria animalis]ROW33300.1 hypothetical protein CGZ60_00945 [Neisseria animalis]
MFFLQKIRLFDKRNRSRSNTCRRNTKQSGVGSGKFKSSRTEKTHPPCHNIRKCRLQIPLARPDATIGKIYRKINLLQNKKIFISSFINVDTRFANNYHLLLIIVVIYLCST